MQRMFILFSLQFGMVIPTALMDDQYPFVNDVPANQVSFGISEFDSSIKLTLNPEIRYTDFIFEYYYNPFMDSNIFMVTPQVRKFDII